MALCSLQYLPGIATSYGRIFRGDLETDLFICNHPGLQLLYAARTKAQLVSRMPK